MSHPVVTFCPYLPLESEIELGPWRIGPLDEYTGSWYSKTFEGLARKLIAAHRDVHDRELASPALVYHSVRGVDGKPPRRDIADRIQTVLNIAVLSENPEWHPEASGHSVATTDNTRLVVWPIDVSSRRKTVAVRRGAIVQMLTGGYEINDDLRIQPPEGLNVPMMRLRLEDAELYKHTWKFFAGKSDLIARMRLAVRWLSKAWINSTAVHDGDRIVFLKTGFEALLAKGGKKRDEAEALRKLFENAYAGAKAWEVEGLLWSPKERARLKWRDRNWKPTRASVLVTPLERWYLDFAEQRNRLIHEGAPKSLTYGRKPYKGPHFFTASRVLLDAIRTTIGDQVGVRLALRPWDRDKADFYKKLGELLKEAAAGS